MKKSLKVLFAVIVCIVLMCPLFAGCASDDAEYVEGSFNYEITCEYGVSVEGTFEINFKKEGNYSIKYDLNCYDASTKKLIYTISLGTNKTVTGSGPQSFYVAKYISDVSTTDNYTAELSNVTITKQKSYDNSHGYAIGFGVTAAVLACGITAFFVVTKLRENKK